MLLKREFKIGSYFYRRNGNLVRLTGDDLYPKLFNKDHGYNITGNTKRYYIFDYQQGYEKTEIRKKKRSTKRYVKYYVKNYSLNRTFIRFKGSFGRVIILN